ncbi:MAG: DUF2771 family protein [Saccharopolyspora rectivirgula]
MHRGLKALLLAAAGLALAGCSAQQDPPKVTFYSHGHSAEVGPAQFCGPSGTDCVPPPQDPTGRLPVPPRAPLQVSVSSDLAKTPWQIAFIYRTPTGEERSGRTQVFAPNKTYAYTLNLPPDGAKLEHVEVQQYSGQLVETPDGGLAFGIGGTWLLDTP